MTGSIFCVDFENPECEGIRDFLKARFLQSALPMHSQFFNDFSIFYDIITTIAVTVPAYAITYHWGCCDADLAG